MGGLDLNEEVKKARDEEIKDLDLELIRDVRTLMKSRSRGQCEHNHPPVPQFGRSITSLLILAIILLTILAVLLFVGWTGKTDNSRKSYYDEVRIPAQDTITIQPIIERETRTVTMPTRDSYNISRADLEPINRVLR